VGRCVGAKTVSRYLDGDLGPAATQQVEEHLAACPRCKRTLDEMRCVDAAVRGDDAAFDKTPDISNKVVAELRHRGAFARARITEGRRRIFGEGLFTTRMAGSMAAALVLLSIGLYASSYISTEDWNQRATPVVTDARRILVQLVAVDMKSEQQERIAMARETARQLALSNRLAQVRSGANPALAADLSYLETTFNLLATGDPLPENIQNDLQSGEALARAQRVLEAVNPGG
jgi:hypothetical protein